MKTKSFTILDALSIGIILIVGILSVSFYQQFPETVATHWNIAGNPDGYSSRATAAFMFPLIIAGVFVLLTFIPRVDPHKDRYQEFQKAYGILKFSIVAFLAVMYSFMASVALGSNINIGKVVPIMVGLLFIVLGNYFGKLKNNWFAGIRTPWTLSNELVWNKTHRLGGKLFVIGGLLMAVSGFVPIMIRLPLFIAIVSMLIVVPIAYSYFVFQKITK